MTEKKVDFVLNNVPFGMFKEFKELAQKLDQYKESLRDKVMLTVNEIENKGFKHLV